MTSKNVIEMGPEGPLKPVGAPGKTATARPAQAPAQKAAAPKPAPAPKAPKAPRSGTNPLRALHVAKVTVNIGVGQSGDRLEKAEKVLAGLTGRKPVRTLAREAHRDWAVRQGQPIGVKVTIRGDDAISFAKRALWTRNGRVATWSFDTEGNLNFGVPDHTAFEGQKYNPEIGVFGMDVAVTVERPGFRVKRRRAERRPLPRTHRITREESQAFLKDLLGLEIV